MPWGVKLLALAVAAYAFSPIDLILDFIPVLGLLDDVVLIPLGIALVVRLAPEQVIASARQKAELALDKPISRAGGVVVLRRVGSGADLAGGVGAQLGWIALTNQVEMRRCFMATRPVKRAGRDRRHWTP